MQLLKKYIYRVIIAPSKRVVNTSIKIKKLFQKKFDKEENVWYNTLCNYGYTVFAGVAELADARDLKSRDT